MKDISIGETALNVVQRGQGKPLLLVHGFPLDHSMWSGQIDALAQTFRVIAPDLRGFGRSGAAGGEVLTMQQMADDLAQLLDAMSVDEPIAFCGLSMGGYVAWQFVKRHSARLDRLIVCDSRAVADTAEVAAGRLKMADRVSAEGAARIAEVMRPKLFAETFHQHQPDAVEATERVMLQTPPATIAAALRGMAEREDVTGWLKEIQIPTLVVCGQHDIISPPAEMREIAAAIRGAKFVEIAGAGHMAPLEDPAAVNDAIADFLKSSQ